MTTFTFNIRAIAYGAETFGPRAFDNSIGKPIKVNAEPGRSVDGIVKAVKVSDDGALASITVEVADALQHLDTSPLRHAPLDIAYAPPRPFPFGPGPDRFTVTYTAPARATLGELQGPDHDFGPNDDAAIERASALVEQLAANIKTTDAIPDDTLLAFSATCECSHSITNHLGGRCNVCPCQRSASSMAVKLNIEEPGRG